MSVCHTKWLPAGGVNSKWEMVWKKAVVADFKVDLLCRNVPG